jgi:hypothetical protein
MKIFLPMVVIGLSVLPSAVSAQILSTMSNRPAQTTARNGIPTGASVYGVFVGRTPCQELLQDFGEPRPECAKRKMGFTLYQDSVTHAPTFYKIHGMAKWSGKGKWQITRGTPTDPQATVFQLELDPATSLFLLKGDDNVLFILDRNRNFLTGNAKYSYTMNRAGN